MICRIVLCFCFLLTPVFASAFVAPVTDEAHFFNPNDLEEIGQRLQELKRNQNIWMVVYVIESLHGVDIESYAERKFRQLEIGQKGVDNGLLLLIAKDDRRMRLEVGYGLEGVFTDSISKHLLDEILRPAFRAVAPRKGVLELIEKIDSISRGSDRYWLVKVQTKNILLELALIVAFLFGLLVNLYVMIRDTKRRYAVDQAVFAKEIPELPLQEISQKNSLLSEKLLWSLAVPFMIGIGIYYSLRVLLDLELDPSQVFVYPLYMIMGGGLIGIPFTFLMLFYVNYRYKAIDEWVDSILNPESREKIKVLREKLKQQRNQSGSRYSGSSSSGSGSSGSSGSSSMGGGGRSGGGGASSSW